MSNNSSKLLKTEDWLSVWIGFLISAEFTLNRYLEWAFWALIVGLLVSNTAGTPEWLKPAVRTEFYIKTGLVIMGFSVLFSNIAKFGLYGLGIAWIVTPVVILFMWWLGTKVLKLDNKPLVITMAAATSVCGTSAAIATGAGAYYYADIPGFEKLEPKDAFVSQVPLWVHIVLFLAWGALMYLLWIWIDRRRD